jgi:hypothetical protein
MTFSSHSTALSTPTHAVDRLQSEKKRRLSSALTFSDDDATTNGSDPLSSSGPAPHRPRLDTDDSPSSTPACRSSNIKHRPAYALSAATIGHGIPSAGGATDQPIAICVTASSIATVPTDTSSTANVDGGAEMVDRDGTTSLPTLRTSSGNASTAGGGEVGAGGATKPTHETDAVTVLPIDDGSSVSDAFRVRRHRHSAGFNRDPTNPTLFSVSYQRRRSSPVVPKVQNKNKEMLATKRRAASVPLLRLDQKHWNPSTYQKQKSKKGEYYACLHQQFSLHGLVKGMHTFH